MCRRHRWIVSGVAAIATTGALALPTSAGAAASGNASCVGQFASQPAPPGAKGEFVSNLAGPGYGQLVSAYAQSPVCFLTP
jgi:hypothetical protein